MIEVFSRWFVGITGEGKVQPPAHTAVGEVRALLLPSITLVGRGSLLLEGWMGWLSSPGALVTEVLLVTHGQHCHPLPQD